MKNKEIEELLNILKKCAREEKATLKLNEIACKTILSYIEQLAECYCNRTDCIGRIKDSKKYDSLLQKYKQLQNNRDKAIEYIETGRDGDYCDALSATGLLNILKGDSDE